MGRIPIHGYIDRIDRAPLGGLEVVDYKTSRELSTGDAKDSDQLSLYQVLVESNYTEPVEGLTLYHLRSLTPLRVPPRGRAALTTLYDRLGVVSDGIRGRRRTSPTPGRHCTRCDFRPICPEFRTVPAADAVRLRELVDRFDRLRNEEHRIETELRDAAEELHHAAEELGIHRAAGQPVGRRPSARRDLAILSRERASRPREIRTVRPRSDGPTGGGPTPRSGQFRSTPSFGDAWPRRARAGEMVLGARGQLEQQVTTALGFSPVRAMLVSQYSPVWGFPSLRRPVSPR